MTDPTSSPQPNTVPGIRDYEIVLPLHRQHDGAEQRAHLIFRIPASDEQVAFQHAIRISQDVDINNGDGESAPWHSSMPDIVVTDVDHVPAPADVEAELRHWRRVVAALAAKLPFALQLTAEEYESADPADIVATPAGDGTMFFLSDGALTAAAAPPPAEPGWLTPGTDPVIEPVGDLELPANHGGHRDPDVRRVGAPTLARARTSEVEIWANDAWHRLLAATINHQEGTVNLKTSTSDVDVSHALNIIARPATVEGYGSDLPKAAIAGQEMLTDGGWMKVASATYMGPMSGAFKVQLVSERESYQTSIEPGAAVLLRPQRPEWWS